MNIHATITHLAVCLPDWNSLDSVRRAHNDLEGVGLVFFALLVVSEALAHLSRDEKRKHAFDTLGVIFFAVAVLSEIGAYPYGQRNDTLSERIIGFLDLKAQHASETATIALATSGKANTKANEAAGAADLAKEKSDRVGHALDAESKRAAIIDNRLGMTQLLVSSRSILNRADFREAAKSVQGKTIFVRSYSGDIEAFFLCTELVSGFQPVAKVLNECGRIPPFTPPVTNIAVFGPTDEEMGALAKVVFSAGIQGGVTSGPYGKVEHSPVNVVFVGTKSPFSMVTGPIRNPPAKIPAQGDTF